MNKAFIYVILVFISGCTLLSEPASNENNNPQLVLDDTFSLIRENYPFISFKKLNLDSLYQFYSSKINSYRGDENYKLLYDILGELKDGHIYYVIPSGYTVQPYHPPRIQKDAYSFSLAGAVSLLQNNGYNSIANGRIIYGILDGNIGYVYVSTMLNDSGQWYTEFANVINYLKGTKGIIVDVRNNGGGSDLVSYFIVSCFIDKPFLSPIWINAKGIEIPRSYLPPNTINYLKPVVLLHNGGCFSATEGFICMMRELNQVTTVGDTTGGGSGNPKDFYISYNLKIHLSTSAELTYQREYIEWNGIAPDVLIPQTKSDVENGNDKQLKEAIRLLNLNLNFNKAAK